MHKTASQLAKRVSPIIDCSAKHNTSTENKRDRVLLYGRWQQPVILNAISNRMRADLFLRCKVLGVERCAEMNQVRRFE